MSDVVVRVDTHLRLNPHEIPEEALGYLVTGLSVVDPDDPEAEPIIMVGMDSDGLLTLPRGFALKLRDGLAKMGTRVLWDDRRTITSIQRPVLRMTLRDYQVKGFNRMLAAQQGIYEAPPGSGKTVTASCLIGTIGMRSLVIVDKINIATQWREEYEAVTGARAGLIGDDVFDEQWVTITTRQGLWAQREMLDAHDWWSRWALVLLDECHNISSPTTREIIQRFAAFYRLGLSATPDRRDYLQLVSRSMIGEIVCRTSDDELEAAGVLVKPRVIAVKTPFFFPWKKRLNAQTQWQQMLKLLKEDHARNTVFAKLIGAQRGHACLIHTEHKGHAKDLAGYAMAAGWPAEKVMLLTGEQSDVERSRVRELAGDGDCVIVSTIGQEALNIPRLDRFFLVFPTKQDYAVRQMVGRIMRTHDTKDSAPIVFDFWDARVFVLNNQFTARRGVYDRRGLKISILDQTTSGT